MIDIKLYEYFIGFAMSLFFFLIGIWQCYYVLKGYGVTVWGDSLGGKMRYESQPTKNQRWNLTIRAILSLLLGGGFLYFLLKEIYE